CCSVPCVVRLLGRWSTIVRFVVVFFFQAEDGIRDWSVTGVQTCALPILEDTVQRYPLDGVLQTLFPEEEFPTVGNFIAAIGSERSEERRVGKECRSRW